jgi:hypothetical protein
MRVGCVVMNSHRKGEGRKPGYHPLSFGGWNDYQQWADHDFVPRPKRAEVPAEPEPVEPEAVEPEPLEPEQVQPAEEEEEEEAPDLTRMARPYVRTGGRAGTEYELRLETMLSTTQLGRSGRVRALLTSDLRMMCRLCHEPKSVAEVAAHLDAPLGVARVLIGDAIRANQLMVLASERSANGRPSPDLLHRVYEGLLRLD